MARDAVLETAFGAAQPGWMRQKSAVSPAVAEVLMNVQMAKVASLRQAVKPICSSVVTHTILPLAIIRVKAGRQTSVMASRNASHLLLTVQRKEKMSRL